MSRAVRLALTELRSGERVLEGDAHHYLARVQRLRAGDSFVAFDPEVALECEATVLEVRRGALRCRFAAPRAAEKSMLDAVLLQCAGKGDKVDEVVRAATALGASGITVCESARVVVRASERALSRHERWRQVALSAAAQSGRGDLPEILGPLSLDDALASWRDSGALCICLHPRATTRYADVLARAAGRRLALLIGPEGGFEDAELAQAENAGFELARFGAFELRTELAGVAALSAALAFRDAAAREP